MKAIILAAGLGTRLRPMTENTPKALVKVNQKPLVEYQIEFLKERGIDEIIIFLAFLLYLSTFIGATIPPRYK